MLELPAVAFLTGIGSDAVCGRCVFHGKDDSFQMPAVALIVSMRLPVETVVLASLAVMVQWIGPGIYRGMMADTVPAGLTQRGHAMTAQGSIDALSRWSFVATGDPAVDARYSLR